MSPRAKSSLVHTLAQETGFDRVGITRPGPSARAEYYRHWVADGQMGSMSYLARRADLRADSSRLMPTARSVICVALGYARAAEAQESRGEQDRAATGRIAAYARGADYHRVLRDMLATLVCKLREALPETFESRICVDTAPVMERELAAAAGLGWIGKNTLLLHERQGSYAFLGELFTTIELEPDAPATDHCGACTRCIDACPTQAFLAPYQMDARRCISYLTIENRADPPAELRAGIGDWVFGCDVCQDVCPYNSRAPQGRQAEIMASRLPARVPLATLTELRHSAWKRMTDDSATRRATARMWRRNANIALQNAAAGAACDT